MKKSNIPFAIIAAFVFVIHSFGQKVEVSTDQFNQEKYDFHYSKHKKQKKTGFILLGSGVAASLAGVLIGSNSDSLYDEANLGTGAILVTAGALTAISSIPVFIVSGSNKRKAQTYVQLDRVPISNLGYSKSDLVSVGVKIEF